ncbi:MAG TPA: gliding motility-associated C-terminal domain-containing protein [Chitinophagales bacterium]|nr:gliding motility-associated C-terminal domain-containing protein [Chitinophagales bacterium]HNA56659.1 gliding motility-associated C-terminal domain-containing protein [Chitinophagales bacterium]HNF68983.1 gliding motility-associated C-terminal domain-containing protein [Chitinophagales bacterium]HNI54070.1 gliding motility-associated C-terminal domain-containing protein [Chitinophagales bacterium]HNK97731.1 gliding motility-associated C-terminal domain-containing protein [Chitinophagales ba
MKHLHRLLPLLILLTCTQMQAQIVGANAFLKGNFVEVGINTCGAYGSNGAPPAGYHPNVFSGLGFVADSDMDGWTTGTPDYCGDYFVPGSPVEGWQVQIGGTVYTNTDQYCWTSEIPGDITSYDYTAGIYTGIWEGTIAAEDVTITQTTTLPENARYFVTRILICNDGPTDLTDVYYMRNVDPDQDQPFGFSFMTTNSVIFQPPVDPDALVESVGDVYGCYLGMGARDENARVTYGCFSTTDGTPAQAWSGASVCAWSSGYSLSGTYYCDCATQVTFKIPLIAAGECQCVAFAYILDADDLDEALEATSSIGVAADGVDISTSGITLICPGDSVELNIIGGEDYDWTWTPTTGLSSGTGDTVVASPDITTTYLATGVGICGTIEREVTVEVPPPPIANAGPDMSLCPSDTIHLAGSGGVHYQWTPPVYLDDDTLSNPAVMDPLTDMYYQLVIWDANGCTDTDDVMVTLYDLPIVDAGDDQYMAEGGFAQLTASGAATYVWTPEDFLTNALIYNPIAQPEDTTMYYVVGTDANGCENIDSMIVYVLDQTHIVVPNAFTPNGDGLNDTWKPVLIGIGEITYFSVYNRWGDLLFESSDPTIGWDGTYQADEQEIGNYIVMVKGLDGFGQPLTKSAMVLLMR